MVRLYGETGSESVSTAVFPGKKLGAAVVFLAASALAILAADSRCLGGPPTAAASAQTNAFNAIAVNNENSVARLGYPKSTADDLTRLVRDWNLESWKQKLAQARSSPSAGKAADVARIEEEAARALYAKIAAEIKQTNEEKYFYLSAVLQDRKAQCLGYSQFFYILGNSVGLAVSVTDVWELADGQPPRADGYAACIVTLSDSTCQLVDLAQLFISKPFVFQDAYAASGNCWELKRKDNPLGIHRRIQVLNEAGIVAGIYNNLGIGYAKAGHPSQFVLYSTKAIELNPRFAEAYCNRGNAYESLGQHQKALSDYHKAIELNPKDTEAFYNRGNAYYAIGQPQKALSDYSKAIEFNPVHIMAFYNRGVAYESLGQRQQALSDYSKAIELNPIFAEAYSNRGNAYESLGQHQQAVSDCTKAIDLNPSLVQAFYNRGNAYESLGQYKQAVSDYSKAIELNPEFVKAFNNRGYAYTSLGQYKQAVSDYSKAIELNPKYAEALYNRGIANELLGQHQQAISDFNKTIELKPQVAEAFYNRGISYAALGNKELARADLKKALELQPVLRELVQKTSDRYKLGL